MNECNSVEINITNLSEQTKFYRMIISSSIFMEKSNKEKHAVKN